MSNETPEDLQEPDRGTSALPQVIRWAAAGVHAVVLLVCAAIVVASVFAVLYGFELMDEAERGGGGSGIVTLMGLLAIGIGAVLIVPCALAAKRVMRKAIEGKRLRETFVSAIVIVALLYGGAYWSDVSFKKEETNLAESGDPAAQIRQGLRFLDGQTEGGQGKGGSDCFEGLKWLRLAAYQGSAEAQNLLGNVYDECVPRRFAAPIEHVWHKVAAANVELEASTLAYIRRARDRRGFMDAETYLGTELAGDQTMELIADSSLSAEERGALIDEILRPWTDEAYEKSQDHYWRQFWNKKTDTRGHEIFSNQWRHQDGRPGAVITSSAMTEELGIAGVVAEVFAVALPPIDPKYSYIEGFEESANSGAVGVSVFRDIENGPGFVTTQYWLPADAVELNSFSSRAIIDLPVMMPGNEPVLPVSWYRTEDGNWKAIDPAFGKEQWNDWVSTMESVPKGDPLMPEVDWPDPAAQGN